ncbi:hypothetical protein FOJ82_13480 [Tessaracoccus rhinocerotis]|uniref:Uncharacterized protein n=1 Tax=Tessaracoccus rhinocerotis TaxID=1689449 RepID=A0A553JWP4_9ACTN|nr:hypothetical protein [Tessaracoccus rhinocerotis]TRY16879.1 hypothetical protein FOJ82_13480 [Tessaracoccus rhinocerotis]
MLDRQGDVHVLAEVFDEWRTKGINHIEAFSPELLRILSIDADTSASAQHGAVKRAMLTVAERLTERTDDRKTRAHRTVFIKAAGFSRKSPESARERMLIAGEAVGRSARTAYRYYDDAVARLTRILLGEPRMSEGTIPTDDHIDVRSRTWVDLREDQPIISSQRTIRSLVDRLDHVIEHVRMPWWTGRETFPLKALEGCALEEPLKVGESTWQYRLRFRKPLEVGDEQSFATSIQFPSPDALAPMIGFRPRGSAYKAQVDLQFGNRRPAALEQFASRLHIEDLHRVPGSTLIHPVQARHTIEFDRMYPGVSYGVRWHWDGTNIGI